MQTIITSFSHVDALVFHKEKTLYSKSQMLSCLRHNHKKSLPRLDKEVGFIISKDSQGKPWGYYGGDTEKTFPFSVSTSHAYPYLYSVASDRGALVGCDVERVRNFEDFFLKSFLHANELSFVEYASKDIRNQRATMIWTIKESLLKALGTGLRIHPKRLDVSAIVYGDKVASYDVFCDTTKIVCNVNSLQNIDRFVFCCVTIPKSARKAICF